MRIEPRKSIDRGTPERGRDNHLVRIEHWELAHELFCFDEGFGRGQQRLAVEVLSRSGDGRHELDDRLMRQRQLVVSAETLP